jgi:hypothetical protein
MSSEPVFASISDCILEGDYLGTDRPFTIQ